MDIYDLIETLIAYGRDHALIGYYDETYIKNRIIAYLGLDTLKKGNVLDISFEKLIEEIDDWAFENKKCGVTVTDRDIFDTELMAILTPRPSDIDKTFFDIYYKDSEKDATDYFYQLNIDDNYIRQYRIDQDVKWKAKTEYGLLDITINLSKPEKDPHDIARAANMPKTNYPICQLCRENEGYKGRINHPARGNLRMIPVTLDGWQFYFQYSPYVYYNEHCIVLSEEHKPMVINEGTIVKLLECLDWLPHYFFGSNADLPIVGGSILAHEHFQGGRYKFAMDYAKEIYNFKIQGVDAALLKWPLSVIRVRSKEKEDIVKAFKAVMDKWINYNDAECQIVSHTDGIRHNTITPIARMNGEFYELDMVLRNNRTTEEYPLGIFHPHAEYHHIKKENIGLIEVMGLAVLPRRLKEEMSILKKKILTKADLREDEVLAKHAEWAEEIKARYELNENNVDYIIDEEIGVTFAKILENCGVFKQTDDGIVHFKKFIENL